MTGLKILVPTFPRTTPVSRAAPLITKCTTKWDFPWKNSSSDDLEQGNLPSSTPRPAPGLGMGVGKILHLFPKLEMPSSPFISTFKLVAGEDAEGQGAACKMLTY